MKKPYISRLFLYFLGNFGLGIGTGLFVQAHQGIGVNMALPYGLFKLFPVMSIGHWTFLVSVPFWVGAVAMAKTIKINALFSFVGSVILAECVDLGVFIMGHISVSQTFFGIGLAILGATIINGFSVGCIGASKVAGNPILFLTLELSQRSAKRAKKPITFDAWLLWGNLLLLSAAAFLGFCGLFSGSYGTVSGVTTGERLLHSTLLFMTMSGIGIGTVVTALFLPYFTKLLLLMLKKWTRMYDDLAVFHINMNYDLLGWMKKQRTEA